MNLKSKDLSNSHRNRFLDLLPWFIIIMMPVVYWLLSRQYSNGPAYLTDEIGYLAKASFLAGHVIDGSSSYFAGYSILLAPLFVLFSDTNRIWQGVLVVNASLWGLSFFLLWKLLGIWATKSTPFQRVLTLLFVSLYPAFAKCLVTHSQAVYWHSFFCAVCSLCQDGNRANYSRFCPSLFVPVCIIGYTLQG